MGYMRVWGCAIPHGRQGKSRGGRTWWMLVTGEGRVALLRRQERKAPRESFGGGGRRGEGAETSLPAPARCWSDARPMWVRERQEEEEVKNWSN
jgi:hypothetical protein